MHKSECLGVGEQRGVRNMIVRVGLAAVAVLVSTMALLSIGNSSAPTANPRATWTFTMSPGKEFARHSFVHTPLPADAPIDEKSEIWVKELQRQIKAYYGAATVSIDQYSPPIYIVPADQPTVRVAAERPHDPAWRFPPLQALWNEVPLPDNMRAADGTDKEAIIYQPSTGRYWEFWLLEKSGRTAVNSVGRSVPEWRAAWGGQIANLAENPGYFPTTAKGYKFGTTATGLVLLGGLMTIDEQRRGFIEHAVHFAIPHARASVWTHPAQRTDGNDTSELAIPQGATFRLPADLDLEKLDMDPYARMVARAVQKYGMVLRDTAGAVTFYAENPQVQGTGHPYSGRNGILRCEEVTISWACSPSSRLRGFPWDRLQALRTKIVSDN